MSLTNQLYSNHVSCVVREPSTAQTLGHCPPDTVLSLQNPFCIAGARFENNFFLQSLFFHFLNFPDSWEKLVRESNANRQRGLHLQV